MTIRNLPEATRDRLAERAEREGRSLQEYMRITLIGMAERPTTNEWLEQVRAEVQAAGSKVTGEDILTALREVRGD